jgi:hypothetical protein
MATAHARKKIAYLEEWIDGATIKKSGGDPGNDDTVAGFAWNLFDHILKIFTILVPLASEESQVASKNATRFLKESLGKLFLWGDGLRDGRLESVLDESEDLKETVLTSFIAIPMKAECTESVHKQDSLTL